MFHSIIIFFISGWVIWFLIGKGPVELGVMLPAAREDMLDNFQLAFDMVKDGYLKASWVFLWREHYFVVSVIGGLLLSMLGHQLTMAFRRRAFWRRYVPVKAKTETPPDNQSN